MARSSQHKLLIHAVGEDWPWVVIDARGKVSERGRADPASPDWPGQLPRLVLQDAGRCTGLSLELPALSASRLDQALRWAAEEHLAGSAEEEHVVAAGRDSEGRVETIVIANEEMARLMAVLEDEPVELVCPDALCLPWEEGQVSLGAADDRVLLRWGRWQFGSVGTELVDDVLEAVAGPGIERVWYGGEVPPAMERAGLRPAGADLLASLAPGALDAPINLLSGPWTPSSARTAGRHWRWAGALAVLVLTLALGMTLLERQLLRAEATHLQAAIDERFGEIFPGVTPAGRHRELAERELARLRFGESAGLLDLMYRTAPVLSGQSGLTLEGLGFRDGQLDVRLRAPDVAALDELEQRLRALDLDAAVQSASLDADGASGRIRIRQVGR